MVSVATVTAQESEDHPVHPGEIFILKLRYSNMLFNGNGSVKLSLHKYSHVSQSFIIASNNLQTVAKGIGLFLCYKWSVPQ